MAKRRSGICKCYVQIPNAPKQNVLLNAVGFFVGKYKAGKIHYTKVHLNITKYHFMRNTGLRTR